MPVVELESVSKRYESSRSAPVWALQDVYLRAESGDVVAITGPSGSGKTTLLNLAGTLDRPTRGAVRLDGVDVGTMDDRATSRLRKERIGFVFQFFNLLPSLTAVENAALPLTLQGVPRREGRRRALEELRAVGIEELAERLPDELSGGEQQRVAVARALVHRPALVLADEPTGNLDSEHGLQVLTLLRDLARARGAAVLLATHNPEAAALCGRVLELRDGALRERGAVLV